jgi:HAD superfamily hydrolase (TIGR01509 family)
VILPTRTVPALNGRTIRGILFDFGDTLWTRKDPSIWYREEQAANCLAVALLRTRIATTHLPALDDETLGNEVRKELERQIRDFKRHMPEYEPDFIEMTRLALQKLGIAGVKLALARDVYEALRVHISPSRVPFPDAFSTLAALRERGFLLGVVTNRHWGGQSFLDDLRALGFLDYFAPEHIAISADLGVRKPNPAIFRHTLNALGLAPQETVMVGDSLSADVAGAKGMDMIAVWKPKTHLFAEARAHHRAVRVAQEAVRQEVYALEQAYLEEWEQSANKAEPLDLESIDDDYLIDYVRSRESKRKQRLYQLMKPDLIIENLSELLDVFVKVGLQ